MTTRADDNRCIGTPTFSVTLPNHSITAAVTWIGLFGVVSFTVQQRVPEMGVRLAFGATPSAVVRLVMRDAGKLVAVGAAAGCLSAVFLTRFLSTMLFATSTTDLSTYVMVVVVLLTSGALASYLPARRAARVDPLVAMRDQ